MVLHDQAPTEKAERDPEIPERTHRRYAGHHGWWHLRHRQEHRSGQEHRRRKDCQGRRCHRRQELRLQGSRQHHCPEIKCYSVTLSLKSYSV